MRLLACVTYSSERGSYRRLKIVNFRDYCVLTVLESSCIYYTLRFSARGFLLRSTSCIHAVVRAVYPCTHTNLLILRTSIFKCLSLAE